MLAAGLARASLGSEWEKSPHPVSQSLHPHAISAKWASILGAP